MGVEKLEAMLDMVNIEIDHVNEYRSGGGMERIAETADRMRKLVALQVNLIEMLIQETTPKKISWNEIIAQGKTTLPVDDVSAAARDLIRQHRYEDSEI